MCPHEDNALAVCIVCRNKDSESQLKVDLTTRKEEETRAFIDQNIKPTDSYVLKLKVEDSDWIPYSITHNKLCQHNGMLRLGNIPMGFKQKDCKKVKVIKFKIEHTVNNLTFYQNLLGQKSTETDTETREDLIKLGRCDHSSPCEINISLNASHGQPLPHASPKVDPMASNAMQDDEQSTSDAQSLQACIINEGWNYAVVIGNHDYEEASGFKKLNSVTDDFKNIVEILANKHNYKFELMGDLRDGIAGPGSTFCNIATDRGFINCENITHALKDSLDGVQAVLERSNNKNLIDVLMFYFVGHGVRCNNQDYLMGISGEPTPVKQIQKALQESKCAKQYILVLDCCREPHKLKIEKVKLDEFEPTTDMNMSVVYSAVQGNIAPDVQGRTMTSCLVELLQKGEKIPVKDLQEELRTIWDRIQMEQSKKVKYTPKVETPPRFPNTLFPYD